MSEILFFPKTVSREIRIRTYTGLVSRPPEQAKRLKLSLSMPLSGRSLVGMPEWLGNAYEFVSKTHDTVNVSIEFAAANLELSSDDLFSKPAKAPKTKLSKFSIVTVGDKENPDVEAQFVAHVQFSRDFHKWCGEYVGDLVWSRFDLIGGGEVSESKSAKDDDDEKADEPTEEESRLFGGNKGELSPEKGAEYASLGTKPRRGRPPAK